MLNIQASSAADDAQYWLELLPKLVIGGLMVCVFCGCLTKCRPCINLLNSFGYSDDNLPEHQIKLLDQL